MNKQHFSGGDAREPGLTMDPTPGPAPAPAGPREDLSAEVAGAMERLPGEVVRCTRVGDTNYRCNWWAANSINGYDNPGMSGLVVTTHRVRRSQFFYATKVDGRLVIGDRNRDR